RFENLHGYEGASDTRAAIAAKVANSLDASFDWAALQRLRDAWHGKFVVKGVARGEDAARLAGLGVDAVWVSNHGGRQLDGAIATADALTDVVGSVGAKAAIVVDGGIRRGTDVIKALALGADAVAIGRPQMYGLAAGGAGGVQRVVELLRAELDLAMALVGAASLEALTPDLVA